MAATVASISFVVPYANDQLCVSRTEYNDTHQPMKLLPAAQFYCEDGQLNDYVSPRDVALGCILPTAGRISLWAGAAVLPALRRLDQAALPQRGKIRDRFEPFRLSRFESS